MDKKEMFSKVGEILKELNEQYQYLAKAPEKMNELEIELFVANANFLADHIKIVQKLNNTGETALLKPAEKIQPEPVEKTPEALKKEEPAKPVEDKSSQETEPEEEPAKPGHIPDELKFDFEKEPVEENEKEKEPESAPEEKTQPSEDTIASGPVAHTVVIREKTISVDTPAKASTEPAPTLNDVIAAQTDQSTVAGKYNRQSVTDLKSIISLNDKLLFVKDLFNGYSLAYSEAIELLNRFDSLDSADNFLKTNYSAKNNWSDKQSTVDKFYEILNRRFTK